MLPCLQIAAFALLLTGCAGSKVISTPLCQPAPPPERLRGEIDAPPLWIDPDGAMTEVQAEQNLLRYGAALAEANARGTQLFASWPKPCGIED